MNIHILCDFIFKEGNIIDLINNYFNNNFDIIDDIYFSPKKIDKNIFKNKLIDKDYINKIEFIRKLYKNMDLKKYITDKINSFIKDTNTEIDSQEIYIIVGLDTSTIYSTKYNNKDITVILLESTNSLNYLNMLLAHEFTHWVRNKYIDHNIFDYCLGERFISEGIACFYSKKISNIKNYECCIVPYETYEWVLENINNLDIEVKNKLNKNDDMYRYFYMNAKIDIPVRTGYVYGFLKILEYLESNDLDITSIIKIDWKEILE